MPPVGRDDDHAAVGSLRKGAACLQCRKRKMRCDAGQPQCANCVKGKKDCQYAAGRAKTKTQLLREKILDLENKIRILEQQQSVGLPSRRQSLSDTSSRSSPIDDDDDDEMVSFPRQHRSLSQVSQPITFTNPAGGAGNIGALTNPGELAVTSLGFDSVYHAPDSGTLSFSAPLQDDPPLQPQSWWETAEDPPPNIRFYLIEVFMQRKEDINFFIPREKFLESISLPPPACPHPSLMNAIYLLGCHFSMQDEYIQREALFLGRAREYSLTSLAQSDRLFDFLMSSNLIAYYLYRTGRFLEGHHQTAGAARFAVSCGLHQIVSPLLGEGNADHARPVRASAPWSVSDMSVRRPGSMLSPPKDTAELGLRIMVFWATYLLDKVGAAVTSLPGSLPDEADPLTEIQTVWPRTMHEYETGDVSDNDYATIRHLYESTFDGTSRRRPTVLGLQAQVTALHERAYRVGSSYSPAMTAQAIEDYYKQFGEVERAIGQFTSTLPHARSSGEMAEIPARENSPINPSLFAVHTLARLAVMQLHNALAPELPRSYDLCLGAARDIIRMAKQLRGDDYRRMTWEIIHSYAWTTCAQVLIREQRNLGAQGRYEEVSKVEIELNEVVGLMSNLRTTFPVVDFQLGKIQEWRQP